MGDKLRTSIVGVTGYTGLELLRMLLAHPKVKLAFLTSRQHENTLIGEVYPHLAHVEAKITNTDLDEVADGSDVVFLALPHKTAQDAVAQLHGKVKLIDLSADYRLDQKAYEKYYGPHNHPELLSEVVYGMPELNREEIRAASSVANPGCHALLSELMLLPFHGTIESADIVSVTGSSGAGKSASDATHHPIRSHNMKSYNVNTHRHIAEIIRTAGIDESQLNFLPTSGPFSRGIFATAFVRVKNGAADAEKTYQGHPFIRLTDSVALANIVGSNYCDLSYQKVSENTYIVQGVLDNLVKGAAGCAVQNMNLMCGLEETMGLSHLSPVYP